MSFARLCTATAVLALAFSAMRSPLAHAHDFEGAEDYQNLKRSIEDDSCAAGFAAIVRALVNPKDSQGLPLTSFHGNPVVAFEHSEESLNTLSQKSRSDLNFKHTFAASKDSVMHFEYGVIQQGKNPELNELIKLAESKGGEVRLINHYQVTEFYNGKLGLSQLRESVDGKPIVSLDRQANTFTYRKMLEELKEWSSGDKAAAARTRKASATVKVGKTVESETLAQTPREKYYTASENSTREIAGRSLSVFAEDYIPTLTERRLTVLRANHKEFKSQELKKFIDEVIGDTIDAVSTRQRGLSEHLKTLADNDYNAERLKKLRYAYAHDKDLIRNELGIGVDDPIRKLFEERFEPVSKAKRAADKNARELSSKNHGDPIAPEQSLKYRNRRKAASNPLNSADEKAALEAILDVKTRSIAKVREMSVLSPDFIKTLTEKNLKLITDAWIGEFAVKPFNANVRTAMDHVIHLATSQTERRLGAALNPELRRYRSQGENRWADAVAQMDPFDKELIAREIGIPNQGLLRDLFEERFAVRDRIDPIPPVVIESPYVKKPVEEWKPMGRKAGFSPEKPQYGLGLYEGMADKSTYKALYADDYVSHSVHSLLQQVMEAQTDLERAIHITDAIKVGITGTFQRFDSSSIYLSYVKHQDLVSQHIRFLKTQNPVEKAFLAKEMGIPEKGLLREWFDRQYPVVMEEFIGEEAIQKKILYRLNATRVKQEGPSLPPRKRKDR